MTSGEIVLDARAILAGNQNKGAKIMKMNARQQAIFDYYNSAGWIAIYYPRKGMISLNGHHRKPVKLAVDDMVEAICRKNGRSIIVQATRPDLKAL